MYPRILHVYGPLWVNGYGLMIAIGVTLFICLTYFHPMRKKLIPGDVYLNTLFLGFLAAVAGGRLLFVLFEQPGFDNIYDIFLPWVGGFSLFGSILAVLMVVPFYLVKKGIKVIPFFDFVVVYGPLLESVSRIGCFFAGCCYGIPAKAGAWFGVTFTDPYSIAPTGILLHPAQLYASFASFVIFIILMLAARYLSKMPGMLLLMYLFLTSAARYTLDFWRGDRGSYQIFVGLLGAASLIAILVIFAFRRRVWGK